MKLSYVMRYVVVVLSLAVAASLSAQPLFQFTPPQQVVNNGDVVCVDIIVDDFTDLLTVDYQIAFDSTVLAFNGASNLALPGLNASSYSLVAPGSGRINFSWTSPGAAAGNGTNFPDFTRIARLCFTVIGPYGSATDVATAAHPVPVVTRENSGNRNIGLFQEDAFIAVGVIPLNLVIGNGAGMAGGSVCVPVRVTHFTDILDFQFALNWDPAVLSYAAVTSLNPGLPGFDASTISSPGPGRLVVTYPSTGTPGPVTLADSAILFQLCFNIEGSCGQSTDVILGDNPFEGEAHNSQNSASFGITSSDGQVDVFSCSGNGLGIRGATRTAAPGQVVCIPFTVQGFQALTAIDFDITWNTGILEFVSLNVPSGVPPNFNVGSFDQSQVASGTLNVDWTSFPWTMANGRELFELCFRVVGSFGVNGVITPDGINGTAIRGGVNIGINPRPGEVAILPTSSLSATFGSATVERGEEFCVDVVVEDFTNLSTVRWSFGWNPAIMRYVRFENFALPNIQANTFSNPSAGQLGLNWWDFSGTTLADGSTLFTLCFEAVGPANSCTDLIQTAIPEPVFIESADQQGYSIGLDATAGTLCIADNRSFTFDVGTATVTGAGVGCVPVVVTNYTEIENWELSLAWNPALFTFNSLNAQALPATVTDLSELAAGRLGLSHNHGASDQSLTDGTVVFDLCYTAASSHTSCSPILEEARPLVNRVTQNGKNRVAVVVGGELCAEQGISVSSTITPAACPDATDGTISLAVTGGSGSYTYTWSANATSTGAMQTGLSPGTYHVTVRDANDASLSETLTLQVPSAGNLPTANAGPDVTIDCNTGPTVELDGSASSAGVSYMWTSLDAAATVVGGATTARPTVSGEGRVELTVTTPAGCSDVDVVEIVQAPSVTLQVVQQEDLPCGGGLATLSVEADPVGNYTYSWSSSGGTIASGQSSATARVSAAGTYTITVRSTDSGCEAQQDFVVIQPTVPSVQVVTQEDLPCGGGLATLRVEGEPAGNYTYSWSTSGGTIASGQSSASARVSAAGIYTITIRSTDSGCEAQQDLVVTQPTVPSVQVVTQEQIPCGGGEAEVLVSVSPSGSYTYDWSTSNGTIVSATTTPGIRVSAVGDYLLRVLDAASGCETQASVRVTQLSGSVVADAGADETLTCSTTNVTIGGPGTTSGADYDLIWSTPNGALMGPTTAATVTATQPGRYFLTVSQRSTGCEAVDSVDVVASNDLPNANAGSAQVITCRNPMVTLQGTGSGGVDFTRRWTTTSGALQAGTETDFAAVATAGGTYTLTIENTATGCSRASTVVVTEDLQQPPSQLPATSNFSCGQAPILLDAAFASDSLGYAFAWIDNSGDTLARTASFQANSDGLYDLLITDQANGCTTLTQTQVVSEPAPQVQAVAAEADFICGRDSILLDLSGSYIPAGGAVSWIGQQPQPDAGAPLRFYAVSAGNYTAVVSSANGACADTLSSAIVLADNRTQLTVDAGDDLILACIASLVSSNASAPSDPSIEVVWRSLDGHAVALPNQVAGGFSESGSYVLTFTDPATACTGRDTLEVVKVTADDIVAQVGGDLVLPCGDAGSTSLEVYYTAPSGDVSLDWYNAANPATSLGTSNQITVSEAGTYLVQITYTASGCSKEVEVEVTRPVLDFAVAANAPLSLICDETATALTADFTPGSGDYSFTWRAIEGEILGSTSSLNTNATAGLYALTVRDELTGCSDSLTVAIAAAPELERATLEALPEVCEPTVSVSATPVANATGVWSAAGGGATFTDATSPTTTLAAGFGESFEIYYTLSTSNCPDYSTDTLQITLPELALTAAGETAFLGLNTADTTLDVSLNEFASGEVNFSILDGPASASLRSDGSLMLSDISSLPLRAEVTYLVCSNDCPDLCEEATLLILREEAPRDVVAIPNAITPNGDGANDVFIIDALFDRPADYPNAKLVIFNRWGDVLYTAQPYSNDWGGETMDGKPIPQGTYYYVLEMDLQHVEIHKGHVTILR